MAPSSQRLEPPEKPGRFKAFKLTNEIFIDQKPGFYEFKNQTRKLTGQQVFEQFESGAGDTREQS